MSEQLHPPRRLDAFKEAQVRYRRDANRPDRMDDLEEWVDFSSAREDARILPVACWESGDSAGGGLGGDRAGVGSYYSGPLYTLRGCEGFLDAPQALPTDVQWQLAYAAVSTYGEPPHKSNLELVPPRPSELINDGMNLWDLWKHEHGFPSALRSVECFGPDKRWYRSFSKLSWSTLGFNYDWTAREYRETDISPLPADVVRLAQYFAHAAARHTTVAVTATGGDDNDGTAPTSPPTPFVPSAGIVNYYNAKSIMGGHRDDSEFALDQPIVSFSTGMPCVFLLGGPSRTDVPVTPILVRPGDVMLMGGSTRLNYHAMARLLPPEGLPPPVLIPPATGGDPYPSLDASVPDEELPALWQFLESHRINVNLRQVYP